MSRIGTLARAQSNLSDQDVNDGLAEIELAKLQRQYRLMEGDRKAFGEEARAQLKMLRENVDKLRKENATLSEDVFLLEQRFDTTKQVGQAKKRTSELLKKMDQYQRKIQAAQGEIQNLDEKLSDVSRAIDEERATEANGTCQKSVEDMDRLKRMLENRLDKSFVKYNRILNSNKELRTQIDALRRERLVFDQIYRKYERELQDEKKRMADIIEASNSAYESRDDIQAKTNLLREKAEKEHLAYIQEIKEIDRTLDQERKLKDFMTAKMAERLSASGSQLGAASSLQKRNSQTKSKAKGSGQSGNSSDDDDGESLDAYERIFNQLLEKTGSKDIYEVLTFVKRADNKNFSLFNYVNEISDEAEKIAREIQGTENAIKELCEMHDAKELERQSEILNVERQLNSYTETAQQLQKAQEEAQDTLHTLHASCKKVFESLSSLDLACNRSRTAQAAKRALVDLQAIVASSGAEQEDRAQSSIALTAAQDKSLLQLLSIIERQANDLLLMNHALTVNKKTVLAAVSAAAEDPEQASLEVAKITPLVIPSLLGQGPVTPVSAGNLSTPSSLEEYESDTEASDDDKRPYTRDELQAKTLKSLSKRETKITTAAAATVAVANGRPATPQRARKRTLASNQK